MKLQGQLADKLPLKEAAKRSINPPGSLMPLLISQRCLSNATEELARHTGALVKSHYSPIVETITMPKRGHGPRPVTILPPEARVLYEALVQDLEPHLPASSRDIDIDEHRKFGTDDSVDPAAYIVDFDIAAFYEYVDHRILAEELLMQTMNSSAVSALNDLLHDMFPRKIGIPQAMQPSHRISDAYIQKLERQLVRKGFSVHRYVDDFRLIAADQSAAHDAIEYAVDMAREIGLVLADGKTKLSSKREVKEEIDEINRAFGDFRGQAEDELWAVETERMGYDDEPFFDDDDDDNDVAEPDEGEVDFVALSKVIEDWSRGEKSMRGVHAHFGPGTLKRLQSARNRLDDDWLVKITEREPIRLYEVISYLRRRSEMEQNWAVLRRLTQLPRQSPWAKLWMVGLAGQLSAGTSQDEKQILDWAKQLLQDRHETVRAEAAWFLSRRRSISMEELAEIYVQASDVTRVGVAACVGSLDGSTESKVGKAIKGDSKLCSAAYSWGSTYVD
ncbi:RNA-directed DNA polymerase [Pseudarthrobacter sp. NIBRBAC000502771]|uniref:RNA-directed DNA polymerase n=1 Tax=Pseudarthrobacter sp. NIBRBAC000502771 TaxID=2590774 RepID=UPI001131A4FA|nr:RNA-directed DNA polymerase [Pseudarthrobacter sp. NIBRBAC000502771]QDG64432.1 RNA-directed DNA polymerase [Pseudarthrobacter sp. NIBRBAC000502771]